MFSPVKLKQQKSGSYSTFPPPVSPHARGLTRLNALKEQNSFRDIDSPKKSPERNSSEELHTPNIKRTTSYGQSSPKRKQTGRTSPLRVEMSDDDDSDIMSPLNSPVVNFLHHNYKGNKGKVPENKAYKYSCESEMSQPIRVTDNSSPEDKRRLELKKKGITNDKHVTYKAEYKRPIEEFIYPSLRPTKEEFERRRLEAKKNIDFSLPDPGDEPDEYELHWQIEESHSKLHKPDLSSTVLYSIGDKGESNLRNVLTTNCKRELKKEDDRKRYAEAPNDEPGLQQVIRKHNIMMGNLFSKTAPVKSNTVQDLYKGTSEDLHRPGKPDAGDPKDLVSLN